MKAQNLFTKLLILVLITLSMTSFGQAPKKEERKHGFYFFWGYNRATYSKSRIHFKGDGYDFTLKGVKAKDRQSDFSLDYINPLRLSVPQYDYRLGYYLKNNWTVSAGFDHMKYVMVSEQDVKIDGEIDTGYNAQFAGKYTNEDFHIDEDFLTLEHTNGLNYINIELAKSFQLLGDTSRMFLLSGSLGGGAGILFPKSDIRLMHNIRNDQWHWAGYGIAAVSNLRLTFKRWLFLEYNLKGGFIHMPDVLTTAHSSDKANQHFFFLERFTVLGVNFRLGKRG